MEEKLGEKLTGAELIAKERQRQIEEEGFDADHDDEDNPHGELAMAAALYALASTPLWNADDMDFIWRTIWGATNWVIRWWKPRDRIRNLTRAGALIAAEIDRLQREDS